MSNMTAKWRMCPREVPEDGEFCLIVLREKGVNLAIYSSHFRDHLGKFACHGWYVGTIDSGTWASGGDGVLWIPVPEVPRGWIGGDEW